MAFLFRSDVRGVSGLAGGVLSDWEPDGVVAVVVVNDPSELCSTTPPPSEEVCDADRSNSVVLASRGRGTHLLRNEIKLVHNQ